MLLKWSKLRMKELAVFSEDEKKPPGLKKYRRQPV
jgi:hypothetical protein